MKTLNPTKYGFYLLFTVLLTLGLSISFQSLLATWTPPPSPPPDGNIAAPINISTSTQTKAGSLILNTIGNENGLYVATGTVGIGVMVPAYKLDILGEARLKGGYNEVHIFLDEANPTTVSPADIFFRRARGTVDSLANVNPDDELGAIDFMGFNNDPNPNDPYKSAAQIVGEAVSLAPDHVYGKLLFKTTGSSGVDGIRMVIDENGNVGIGTINPAEKLDVNGKIRATDICDENGNCHDITTLGSGG